MNSRFWQSELLEPAPFYVASRRRDALINESPSNVGTVGCFRKRYEEPEYPQSHHFMLDCAQIVPKCVDSIDLSDSVNSRMSNLRVINAGKRSPPPPGTR